MAQCELIKNCIFFNDQMANMPTTAALFKQTYCEQDASKCARYRIFQALGRGKVPSDLFPNQESRAKQIIEEASPKR